MSDSKDQSQEAFGWAARDSSGILAPFHFTRRINGEGDITIKILYCGICHSDLHMVRNEQGFTLYPLVPGHEIIGVVTQVGTKVEKFKTGDKAGVGTFVGSCGTCSSCLNDSESYCPKLITTYTISFNTDDVPQTHGGFSDIIVVNEKFAVNIPDNLPLASGAPLLCAGITVYSPMRYNGLDKAGMHVGVAGLGGLGHLAVKFAKAFGMKVTVISTSEGKRSEAIEKLKADLFVVSTDSNQMQGALGTMDGIIDTVAAPHPLGPLLHLLKDDGKLVLVGAPDPDNPAALPIFPLFRRKYITGSMAGGMKETQEMIDFAAEHNISAETEIVPICYVNTAMTRLEKGDVRYRFVIDIANTLST